MLIEESESELIFYFIFVLFYFVSPLKFLPALTVKMQETRLDQLKVNFDEELDVMLKEESAAIPARIGNKTLAELVNIFLFIIHTMFLLFILFIVRRKLE